ncbi:hypothetical protein CEP54_009722 [Fusarium duplospermum]|uniref:Uncharacterized protein n=1 Tax=Fusarium duplospermum TaxID=1325734 RepID=A0A428PNZ6_9HYPO|nr:hypothetical protein CEP54_009722 [Fusarium duplospermum]
MDRATTLHERRRLALRDICLESAEDVAEYNLGLHVTALFVLFIVSGMAAVFPVLATRYTFLRIPPTFFFVVRHFGTGVLIATAFCHLLPTAFSNFNDPCMGEFWTETYAAMPGAISLGSVFIVMTIEMLVSPFRRTSTLELMPAVEAALQDSEGCCSPASCGKIQETDVSINEKDLKPKRIQVVLLEAGIIFHSIFVGLTLGVTTGSAFVSLFVAIIFHQSFEGPALGSRIALAGWSPRTWRPWMMALAYGCTQLVGIGTHKLYSPDSQVGHTVVGFFNAVSSGFLLYAALVELLSEDFLSQRSWYEMRGGRRVVAFALVFVGAFLMALIAHWV